MSQSRTVNRPLVLQAGSARATLLPQYGGLIQSLRLPTTAGVREVIDGVADDELPSNPGYKGVLLFPFPNRLRDGRYRFGGKEYRFAPNEAATNTALHGLLYRWQARVESDSADSSRAEATLVYVCDGRDEGYPFCARVAVRYVLQAHGALSVDISVSNNDSVAIPVGIGWHPYYQLGAPLDQCKLTLPPVDRVIVDERMLPTGELVEETRFARAANLSDTQLDDCFILREETQRASARFTSRTSGVGLQLWQRAGREGMNYMQLYTPPNRQSLAVEPMSCGIDAFNTGAGLVTLQPGQVFDGAFGVEVIEPQ